MWLNSCIIAHRGAPLRAPENTLAALRAASELGAPWVEFDVRLTRDNVAVIFHDDTLSRITGVKGTVEQKTYAEIQQLDAGSWFSAEYRNEKIPTLREFLECAAKLNLGVNIELKNSYGKEKILAEQVVSLLRDIWTVKLPAPLISSFNPKCLRAIYACNPELGLGYLFDRWPLSWRRRLAREHCASLNMKENYLTQERVAKVKTAGFAIVAYTVNDKSRALELLKWGVDGIVTNDPGLLLL